MPRPPDLANPFRHAATYVDKIRTGPQPGDLPVEQAMKLSTRPEPSS